MKKIALTAVLAIGALGMACGGATSNNANNSNKTNVNVASPTPMATPMATVSNMNANATRRAFTVTRLSS